MKLYLNEDEFDKLDEKTQMLYRFCPNCKRYYKVSEVGNSCGCTGKITEVSKTKVLEPQNGPILTFLLGVSMNRYIVAQCTLN
jgi:hypothetical protein